MCGLAWSCAFQRTDSFTCSTTASTCRGVGGAIHRTASNTSQGLGGKTRLAKEEKSLYIKLPLTLRLLQPPAPFTKPSPSHLLLTASFGHLIPTSLLSLFSPLNALNVHPSLLPRYRGAAPIQWAIANGDLRTGVSVQELSRGKFDQGRLLGQRHVVRSTLPLLIRQLTPKCRNCLQTLTSGALVRYWRAREASCSSNSFGTFLWLRLADK